MGRVMTNGEDFMKFLPVEMRLNIISFLDAESLISCSSVNETWNEITNDVPPKIWVAACRTAGIYARRDDYKHVKCWKAFLSAMLERIKDLKDSACFSTVPFKSWRSCGQVRAIYYHNEKLAIAYNGGSVEIWSLPEDKRLRKFDCEFEPSYLKFDDEILVAATVQGVMSSWTIASGKKNRSYTYYNTTLKSFDFLTRCDILVGNYTTSSPFANGIYVWNLQNSNVFRQKIRAHRWQDREIVRVMLAPHPDSEEQGTCCYLFSLASDCVGVWEVEFLSDEFSSQNKQFFEFRSNLHNLPVFEICKEPGLLFDGVTLYVLPPTRPLAIWNPAAKIVRYLGNDDRIISLLGFGDEYLVYEIRKKNRFERVIIADRIRDEIEKINVPGTNSNDDGYSSFSNTSWLDGVNGRTDYGGIYMSITEDEVGMWVTKFEPR